MLPTKILLAFLMLALVFGCGGKSSSRKKKESSDSSGAYVFDESSKPKETPERGPRVQVMVTTKDTVLMKRRRDYSLNFGPRDDGYDATYASRVERGYTIELPAGTRVSCEVNDIFRYESPTSGIHVLRRVDVLDGEHKGERGRIVDTALKPAN